MGTRKIKSPLDLTAEMEQAANKKFLEEYKEVVEPLNQKHGRRLVPIISPNIEQGIFPVFGIQRIIKEEVTVQPANEKREESETN
jgi:hypothetical protein